ncbi:hypothetical protein SERLADRAFT_433056 [Serpula lacrymans var. lacrymans S7.9]|uniref:Uncharacterized protein n=1 Tax=Serpula lacrymans var. lacrymans (strain S7.9) TaxID=578457 RepID=F8NGA8_SERL9|nr:uncharacterized protein SERLADRAFT_433056 [Serpula lacrymans var. lacrymans S7.9]EGO29043.1 hypothetical protein SERLADRAFT_433056 [Serpula lacrymans var. lacrymans S7.9]
MHYEVKAETNKTIYTFSTIIKNLILAQRAGALEFAQKLLDANEQGIKADAELARKEVALVYGTQSN